MPYRDAPGIELRCPRCKKPLPPLEVATCTCGVWISAFAATEVLTVDELKPDLVTRWWKVRAPCPMCEEQMVLRGTTDPGLFQGCDGHGFWIDTDSIEHTSLARGIDHEALQRKRDDETRLAADRERREAAEVRRAQLKADKMQREARLAHELAEARRAEERRRAAERAEREKRERAEREAASLQREQRVERMLEARRAEREPAQVEARTFAALSGVVGNDLARYLFDRFAALEKRNRELEARLAELESD